MAYYKNGKKAYPEIKYPIGSESASDGTPDEAKEWEDLEGEDLPSELEGVEDDESGVLVEE
jgi:hypothetical protein